MMKSASVAVAAALLLSGVSAAAAAMGHMTKASDTLDLSATQQKEIWKDLSRHATNQTAPSGFNAAAGEAIPSGIRTYPLPRQAAARRAGREALSLRHDPGQGPDREPARQEDRGRGGEGAVTAGARRRAPACPDAAQRAARSVARGRCFRNKSSSRRRPGPIRRGRCFETMLFDGLRATTTACGYGSRRSPEAWRRCALSCNGFTFQTAWDANDLETVIASQRVGESAAHIPLSLPG